MIRTLAQWHEHPRLVAGGATATGRILVWSVAGALLAWQSRWGDPVVRPLLGLVFCVMVLVTVWPCRRREILSGASVLAVLALFQHRNLPGLTLLTLGGSDLRPVKWLQFALLALGVLLGLAVTVRIAHGIARWPPLVRRFPVLSVHAGAWTALALIPVAPVLGIVAELLPFFLGRLTYLVQYFRRNRSPQTGVRNHLFYLWPLAGVDQPVPMGKGLEYLSRHEARTSVDLAGSQLAGIKLLGLAVAWTILGWCLDAAVYGSRESPAYVWFGGWSLEWPDLRTMMESHRTGMLPGLTALYVQLIRETLRRAVIGHVLVGCWRLIGFRIFRDVYRPLLAKTLIEFWNRRTWYLKELLTEFFFYPAYVRNAWAGQRLRLFLAVFAAAGVGNLYYHAVFAIGPNLVEHQTLLSPGLMSHAVYSTLLAFGIWLSMLREQGRRRQGAAAAGGWRILTAIPAVWTFYAIVHLWSAGLGPLGPLDRLRWLMAVVSP